ncbi:TTYH2 [Bugula neritina]|uniref:Protein tweety homolog n=1 Tax=Bugula neritina TaxID=10212 RepID=A0A7J7KR49_BUGNE|nr:TTYH2 [Bugula neritina]
MAVDIGETMYYNISELVKFFHSFPHYDLQFDPIDPKFDPQSQPYLQSLILVAAVPVLWMLLWILIYLAYFCYLCVTCRKNRVEKSTKSPQPSRWFSFFFYVLVILMITVSFYSNEVIDHNAQSVKDHLHKIQLHTGKIQIQSAVILQSIDKLKDETAVSLKQEFTTSSVLDEQERPKLQGLADDMTESLSHANEIVTDSVQDALRKLTFDSSLSKIISDYEKYRHLATHAVSGFIILATILSMFSLACKKKGFILMCVALAVFNVILVWAGVGAYSALSVGTSDFCMDPTGYLVQQLPSSGMVPEGKKFTD